jgi:hypothetical protein
MIKKEPEPKGFRQTAKKIQVSPLGQSPGANIGNYPNAIEGKGYRHLPKI